MFIKAFFIASAVLLKGEKVDNASSLLLYVHVQLLYILLSLLLLLQQLDAFISPTFNFLITLIL